MNEVLDHTEISPPAPTGSLPVPGQGDDPVDAPGRGGATGMPPTSDTSDPPPPPPAPPTSGSDRSRGRRPFLGGLAVGVVVATAVCGAIAVATNDGDAPVDSPATQSVTPPASDRTAATAALGSGASVHDLVVAVRPSIVAIHTTLTQTDVFGRQLQGDAAGSGFVLSADGFIVTNDHVIDGADSISVALDDGTTEDATLVGADPRSDLAVLHIDRTDLTPLAIGDSDVIEVGDPVVAIGNALDLGAEPTVTGGLVSAKERTITEPNGQVLVDLIQTDAAISPGNSGGPLIDAAGRVIGINTAVAGQGQNIGFALAIDPAKTFIDQLRNGDTPRHALLGVSTVATGDGTDGAVVTDVAADSGAQAGGVLVGDVITAFGSDTITSPADLVAAIARRSPGDTATLTVRRDGADRELTVTLGAHDEVNS